MPFCEREGEERKNILKIIIKEGKLFLHGSGRGERVYIHMQEFFSFLKKINLGMKLVVIHNFVRFWCKE